jgi:hypothetical protein
MVDVCSDGISVLHKLSREEMLCISHISWLRAWMAFLAYLGDRFLIFTVLAPLLLSGGVRIQHLFMLMMYAEFLHYMFVTGLLEAAEYFSNYFVGIERTEVNVFED